MPRWNWWAGWSYFCGVFGTVVAVEVLHQPLGWTMVLAGLIAAPVYAWIGSRVHD